MASSRCVEAGHSLWCNRTPNAVPHRSAIAPTAAEINQIDVDAEMDGDGLLIDGGDLVVVEPTGLTFVRLNGRADRGRVVERRPDPSFREPSTVARARTFYLVVNATSPTA